MGTTEIFIIIAMVAMNSIFAGYELALASVNLGRLKILADQKRKGALAALSMKNRMEASLAVVQIGITLVGAIAAATGGAEAQESIAPWMQRALGVSPAMSEVLAIALIVLPLSAAMIVVGELVPKTLSIKHSEWVCLSLSPAMRVLAFIVYPLVIAFEWVTMNIVRLVERNMPSSIGGQYEMGLAELRAQTKALRTGRIIGATQEQIILGASDLSKTRVADILVEPQDIVMLNADAPIAEHLVTVHTEAYTRFPVTEKAGDPQGIIGYVNLKELIFIAKTHPDAPTIRQITRQLLDIPPDTTIGDAFARMMREHVHLALVRDSDNVIRGIITLEDILEELVGDIQDEFDRMPRYITQSGNQWVVGGGATLKHLRVVTGCPDLGENLSGDTSFTEWIKAHYDKPFKGGDMVAIDGSRVLIRKVRRQKILEGLLEIRRDIDESSG